MTDKDAPDTEERAGPWHERRMALDAARDCDRRIQDASRALEAEVVTELEAFDDAGSADPFLRAKVAMASMEKLRAKAVGLNMARHQAKEAWAHLYRLG